VLIASALDQDHPQQDASGLLKGETVSPLQLFERDNPSYAREDGSTVLHVNVFVPA
jgi:hypothetical protein